ncbi:calcium uniporter protein 2, mitochondrial-like [Curcuma longa]|uniref:calcium uniporter protein 2, mitochondrial-like n=1 Tax=Curcuma longa TaxID=136217 RepID=UPI003D9E3ADF
MALRKTLGRRFFNVAAKLSSPDALPRPPRPAPSLVRRLLPGPRAHEPSLLGRFLHRTPSLQSASPPPPLSRLALPVGDGLLERIREMNTSRIRLEGILPPPPLSSTKKTEEAMVSAAEARKVVRAARMEAARSRLRETGQSCVSYSEFARVCREAAGGTEEGVRLGEALDESASVIVLGDVVLVRPEMVTTLIQSLIRPPASSRQERELKEMEVARSEIEASAEAEVRRELWAGLALLAAQTAGFMRLTFWELSWDVMEPVCFYVTSLYFMLGYAFFLRTSRDPSFEGFFQSRLDAKRNRLMKKRNFDVGRFNELKREIGGTFSASSPSSSFSSL